MNFTSRDTYGRLLADAAAANNLSIRQLARATGYSYEHVRKAFGGTSYISHDFNTVICKALRLDADKMWMLALQQKMETRFSELADTADQVDPDATQAQWNKLSTDDQNIVRELIARLAKA